MYHLDQHKAVAHLFRVASGLDSMVPGEPQILGQLKDAFKHSMSFGATGELLNRLFQRAFGVAKSVRTQTGIGRNAVSVAFAGKELAARIFGDLSDASVMLLGAGDTGSLILKHLHKAGVERVYLANKTLERAAVLANEFNGVALDLGASWRVLPEIDIVVGACRLPLDSDPLISTEQVRAAQRERRGKPQFFIDLSVPRNFSQDLNELADVFLYNIDDLQGVVAENMGAREQEQVRASHLIDEQVERFNEWIASRAAFPLIKGARSKSEEFRRVELAKTLRRMRRAGFYSSSGSTTRADAYRLFPSLACQGSAPSIYDNSKACCPESRFAAIIRRVTY